MEQFENADTYGSLITVQADDGIDKALDEFQGTLDLTFGHMEHLMQLYKILSQLYDVVCTNPPYMGGSGMNAKLSDFVKKYFPDSKSDLFACFIEKCGQLAKPHGFYAMITQHAFMFLSSYENLRRKLMNKTTINMAHLGIGTFEDLNSKVVQSVAFITLNTHINCYLGRYDRLFEKQGLQESNAEKEKWLINGKHSFYTYQENFSKIPGMPVAYWISQKIIKLYENGNTMEGIAHPKVGMQTSNNDKYLRLWFEINYNEFNGTSFGLKWIKYLKGGPYRKWYGNLEYLLWYNKSQDFILQQKNARVLSLDFLEKPKVTWTDLTTANNSFRIAPHDTFYDISGHCFFPSKEDQCWLLAYSNSVFFREMLKVFNSSIHCQVGDVSKIVVPELNESQINCISIISEENVTISKTDWDSFETSWDFEQHPLI